MRLKTSPTYCGGRVPCWPCGGPENSAAGVCAGNYELTPELNSDEWGDAAGTAGGVSDRALNEGPIHLSQDHRDAALVRVLNETSRVLARMDQLVSGDLGRER